MTALETVCVALATALTLFLLLPSLLGWLGLSSLRCVASGGPLDIQPLLADPLYARYAEELSRLGFEPLGLRNEVTWLFANHIRWKSPTQIVFGSQRHGTFAVLYRIFPFAPPKLGFLTRFDGDTLLWTSNSDVEVPSSEGFARKISASSTASGILEDHLRHVEACHANGKRTHSQVDLESSLAATNLTYEKDSASGLIKQLNFDGFKNRAVSVLLLLVLVGATNRAMHESPIVHWSISLAAAALVVWGLAIYSRWSHIVRGLLQARSMRRELATA